MFVYGGDEPGRYISSRRKTFIEKLSAFSAARVGEDTLLFLNGAGDPSMIKRNGEQSYPNFGGPLKHLHHPDMRQLAQLCEEARVDLRVVVMLRDALSILRSTNRRRMGGSSWSEASVLALNADVLAGQIHMISPDFIMCCELDQLGSQERTWDVLAPFLHSNLTAFTPRIVAAMHPPRTSPSIAEEGAYKVDEHGNLQRPIAAHERQLASSVQRLRSACGERRTWVERGTGGTRGGTC